MMAVERTSAGRTSAGQKAERARIKKRRRTIVYGVSGDETVSLKAGRKKFRRHMRAHLSIFSVNHISKAGSQMPNG